jgi:hypothetical protein
MPAGYGNFSISDCYPQIMEYCAGRVFPEQKMTNWVYRSVLELAKDYWFQGLQATGPFVNFTQYQNVYEPSFFTQPGDSQLDLNKIVSFPMYYPPIFDASSLPGTGSNPLVVLRYREITSAENTMAITSFPSYWSRWQGQILISPNPTQNYLGLYLQESLHLRRVM